DKGRNNERGRGRGRRSNPEGREARIGNGLGFRRIAHGLSLATRVGLPVATGNVLPSTTSDGRRAATADAGQRTKRGGRKSARTDAPARHLETRDVPQGATHDARAAGP